MKKGIVLLIVFLGWGSVFSYPLRDKEEGVIQKGKEITNQIGKKLVQTVLQAVGRGGVKEGVGYCHVQAVPLTDSLSKKYGVEVRRVALRYRNERNKPTKLEEVILSKWERSEKELGTIPSEEVHVNTAGDSLYFRPIILQPTCQMCHGKVGETLSDENYALIQAKYPKDKAIGFSPGDLRGMWVVRFTNH